MLVLIVQELGKAIVLPTINIADAQASLRHYSFYQFLAATTGGQFTTPTLLSIGLAPYMTGMILLQAVRLLDIDAINNMPKRVESTVQRLAMLVIGFLQALQLVYFIRKEILPGKMIAGMSVNFIVSVLLLVAGTMFVCWLADMNSEYGAGGLGFMLMPSLISATPRILMQGQGLGTPGMIFTPKLIAIIAVVCIIFVFTTVWINKAERRLVIKRPMISSDFESSNLPIRVLAAGSMPLMFSTSVFIIPRYLVAYGAKGSTIEFVEKYFSLDNIYGVTGYCLIVLLLGSAFAFMNVQPEQIAKSLKKSGDYIAGFIPGDVTRKYISHEVITVSFIGNVYLTVSCGLPLILGLYFDNVSNLSFLFSNVIIMVTILDNVVDQFRAMYSSQHYDLLHPTKR
ncbi:secY protein [Furfurilactobacillus siliginis]|uniref:SecY protein n=1 Tax=Furfurilactobacillus siliginis TaxID=348151 RepID=A0A0R2L673_9LACO|nr:secY protein [Furfurilactobacillus siliginis]